MTAQASVPSPTPITTNTLYKLVKCLTIVIAMTTLNYPHPTLTKILGRPTAPAVWQLRREIYANARRQKSYANGNKGLLGCVMPLFLLNSSVRVVVVVVVLLGASVLCSKLCVVAIRVLSLPTSITMNCRFDYEVAFESTVVE